MVVTASAQVGDPAFGFGEEEPLRELDEDEVDHDGSGKRQQQADRKVGEAQQVRER